MQVFYYTETPHMVFTHQTDDIPKVGDTIEHVGDCFTVNKVEKKFRSKEDSDRGIGHRWAVGHYVDVTVTRIR